MPPLGHHVRLDPDLAELHLAELADVLDVEHEAERLGRGGVEVVQPHAPAASAVCSTG